MRSVAGERDTGLALGSDILRFVIICIAFRRDPYVYMLFAPTLIIYSSHFPLNPCIPWDFEISCHASRARCRKGEWEEKDIVQRRSKAYYLGRL